MKSIGKNLQRNSISVLGIPFDKQSSFLRGAAKAPLKIRESYFSSSSNLWTETGLDLGKMDRLIDLGDIEFGKGNEFPLITETVNSVLEKENRLICLGGDHSITFPIIDAFAQNYEALNILHLDAHPDLYDSLDGNIYSHACPFARIMEKGWVKRLVQGGIRGMNGHQRKQAKKFCVETHEMIDGDDWIDHLKFEGPVYLSIDLDCLDPAFAPGVSHHEPGGLSTRQVLHIIHRFKGNLIGADIVEYNPDRDIHSMTGMVAAKVLKEVIGRMAFP